MDVMADHGDYRPAVRLDLTHGWLEGPAIRFVYRCLAALTAYTQRKGIRL